MMNIIMRHIVFIDIIFHQDKEYKICQNINIVTHG